MSSPFIGEIRMFGGSFAPAGWAFCNGAIVPISENDALFNLIGTTYGGDGQSTFALPNLQSRVPVHVGTGYTLGQTGGVENVTLTTSQIPAHSHPILAENNVSTTTNTTPINALYGNANATTIYSLHTGGLQTMMTTGSDGGSQPHTNLQPFLVISFIISLFGIFPSQT